MPSTNTSDLAQTTMGLARQAAGAKTASNTFKSFALCNGNGINQLILSKDFSDFDFLFKQICGQFDLVVNGTAIDLNFQEVSPS